MTFSELVVTLLIWALAGCGAFFGLRARLRQRNSRRDISRKDRPQ